MEASQFKVRKRNPKACRRCHRRKQRCVGYPTCTNCEAANSSCTRSETSTFQPASERYHGLSKDALFDRIEELEAQLNNVSNTPQKHSPRSQYANSDRNSLTTLPDVEHLFDVMEFLTTGHMTDHTRQVPISSAGTLIAKEMDQIFEETVLKSYYADNTNREPEVESKEDKSQPAQPAAPSDAEGLKYIRIYMETMHNHMPYIDSEEIYQLHDDRLGPIAPTRSARWKSFKLYMVYAIGAATCRAAEPQPSVSVNDLLRIALELKPPVTELRSLQSIEAMMLLIMYNLRIPNSSNIWYMIGLAMRTAIDLGLHRETNYLNLKPDESQRRRRLFWSVYVMDRSIARLLDRPFNIAECDIDVGLPFDYQEPYSEEQTLRRERHLRTSIAVFIPSIRLIRLKSQIQTRVHRVDKEVSLLLPEINPLFSKLEEYRRSLQTDLSPMDKDWISMHWNNGILVLIQPFLGELPSDHELIRTCMKASGKMCQVFKALHQKGYIGFGYFLVSTLFKAGLTLCYCLFRSSQPCSIDVANDLGACSSVLFAIAERNKQLEKYRDTWEAVLTKVMEHLGRVSSSHEIPRAIIQPPQLSDVHTLPSMDDLGTESFLSGTCYPLLDNLNSGSVSRLQGIWNESCDDDERIDQFAPSVIQPLISGSEDLYPAGQGATTKRPTLWGKDIMPWSDVVPQNLFEDNRMELRMFDELFGS